MSGKLLTSLVVSAVGAGLLATPTAAPAGTPQEQAFFDTLKTRCADPLIPFGSRLFNLCASAFSGGLAGGSFVPGLVGTNVGTSGLAGTASQSSVAQQRKCVGTAAECRDSDRRKGGGASADFSFDGFGFMVSAQTGGIRRKQTDLENAFDADVLGIMAGVDYRFSDRLLVGLNLGHNDNDATFRDGAGGLRAKTTSGTAYLTYAPLDNAYLGAYLGTGRIRNGGNKRVLFGGVAGTTTSANGGSLDIAGLSGGYDWGFGTTRVGGFLNVDSARSRLDGYTESGNTGLELIQPGQSVQSLTSTLGVRISGSHAYEWGTMLPEFRLAHVHEYRNKARVITTALAIDPTTRFTVNTDSPDRNYFLMGLGANFEVGRGNRWFLDYERRMGHAFFSTWAASAGVILGF